MVGGVVMRTVPCKVPSSLHSGPGAGESPSREGMGLRDLDLESVSSSHSSSTTSWLFDLGQDHYFSLLP